MKKIKWILSLMICVFIFSFTACGGEKEKMQTGTIVNILSVNQSEATLEVGDIFRVVGVCGEEQVSYQSSNEEVASVSSEGVVTAKSEGIAYIIVAAGQQSKRCKISVVQYDYSVILDESYVLTVVGTQKKIMGHYSCNGTEFETGISWSVNDAENCSLKETDNGVIFSAKEKGVYTLTATGKNAKEVTCVIKVMSLSATILQTPVATIENSTIRWTAVENATAYWIKIDDGDWEKVKETSCTLAETTAKKVYIKASAEESCDFYDSDIITVSIE